MKAVLSKLRKYMILTQGILRSKKCVDNNDTLIIFNAAFGDAVLFQDHLKYLVELYERENRNLCMIARRSVRSFYTEILNFDERYFNPCVYTEHYSDWVEIIRVFKNVEFKNVYAKDGLGSCVIVANINAEKKIRLSSQEELKGREIMHKFFSNLCFTKTITVPMKTWELERHKRFFEETEGITLQTTIPDMKSKLTLEKIKFNNPSYAVICVDSSVPYRRWKLECWRELAQKLHDKYSFDICYVGEKRNEDFDVLLLNCEPYVHDYVGRTTLRQWFSLIRYSAIVLSVDSGIIHVAASLGVPSACLRGFYELDKYFPYRSLDSRGVPLCITAKRAYSCQGCLQRRRVMKEKNKACYDACFSRSDIMFCLFDIETEDVFRQIEGYLKLGG